MATSHIEIAAPVGAVWDSLIDPWTYEVWVRGAKQIRRVDASWPQPGSRFHHLVGVGAVGIADATTLVRAERHRLIELDASAWPLGRARIVIELEDLGGPTEVRVDETPSSGPAKWLDNPAQDAVLKYRNDSSLARLKAIVEQRLRTAGA